MLIAVKKNTYKETSMQKSISLWNILYCKRLRTEHSRGINYVCTVYNKNVTRLLSLCGKWDVSNAMTRHAAARPYSRARIKC